MTFDWLYSKNEKLEGQFERRFASKIIFLFSVVTPKHSQLVSQAGRAFSQPRSREADNYAHRTEFLSQS